MSVKQKLLAVFLSVVFLGMAFYLIFMNYGEMDMLQDIKNNEKVNYIIDNTPTTVERYKIINITYEEQEIYAIVYLDNGNIRLIKFSEAWIDPNLKNINEGYLYRENGQIYIRTE